MIYHVQHTTVYTYTEMVSVSHNELHLKPRDTPGQTCRNYALVVHPHPAVLSHHTDFFGNDVMFLAVQEPHRVLSVTADSTVEVRPGTRPAASATPAWDTVRDRLSHSSRVRCLAASQYIFDSPHIIVGPDLRHLATASFPPGRPLLEAVADLTARISMDFTYDATATSVSTPLDDVLRHRHGVCQDFAHLQIGCLRALGLAARYVSGYLVTQPPPGQARLIGADASHAWVSVYCPGYGWLEVDPTNNTMPTDGHITVAYGRDYSDVTPIKGVFFGGGEHTMQVIVNVAPA